MSEMINRLWEELRKMLPPQAPTFDPGCLGDPVALKTQWTPAKSGGTNIRTHVLRLQPDGRAAFRPSFWFLAFCSLFLLIGLGADIGFIAVFLLQGKRLGGAELLIPLAFGTILALVGGLTLVFLARPVVFDKALGLAWRGWRDPGLDYERAGNRKSILCVLDDIHALQIVSEYVRGNKSSYTSYELNLIMEDATRINVVDHGDLVQLRTDAAVFGEYLEVDVWDATLLPVGQVRKTSGDSFMAAPGRG